MIDRRCRRIHPRGLQAAARRATTAGPPIAFIRPPRKVHQIVDGVRDTLHRGQYVDVDAPSWRRIVTREPSATSSFEGRCETTSTPSRRDAIEDVVAAELARDDLADTVGSKRKPDELRSDKDLDPAAVAVRREQRRAAFAAHSTRPGTMFTAPTNSAPSVGRGEVELLRRAGLHDRPVAHQRDAVGEGERLLAVVGDRRGR